MVKKNERIWKNMIEKFLKTSYNINIVKNILYKNIKGEIVKWDI